MIERVSEMIFLLAQICFFLWPVFIITVLIYSFQGRLSWRTVTRRLRRNLLITWLLMFGVWAFTLLARDPNPSIIPEPWNEIIFFSGLGLLLLIEVSKLKLFRRRVTARFDLHRAHALDYLKSMDPYAFEDLVAETYRAYGHQARQVGQSGDHGVDVEVITSEGKRWVVQCKRYRDSVGESIVRELYGTMVSEKADRAVLVTTADITPPAEAWARGKPIVLVDGPALLKLIEGARQRSEGTLFDRFTRWLENIFTPPGLRRKASRPTAPRATHSQPATPIQPARPVVQIFPQPGKNSPNGRERYWHGVPVCPTHLLPMIPRPARPSDRPGRVLYRCRKYPECRVVLEGPDRSNSPSAMDKEKTGG